LEKKKRGGGIIWGCWSFQVETFWVRGGGDPREKKNKPLKLAVQKKNSGLALFGGGQAWGKKVFFFFFFVFKKKKKKKNKKKKKKKVGGGGGGGGGPPGGGGGPVLFGPFEKKSDFGSFGAPQNFKKKNLGELVPTGGRGAGPVSKKRGARGGVWGLRFPKNFQRINNNKIVYWAPLKKKKTKGGEKTMGGPN